MLARSAPPNPTPVRSPADGDHLRVGVHSGQQYQSFAECAEVFRRAESLGYDQISIFDHYRPPMGGADGPCLDAPTTLAALAALTSSVRCVLLVAPPTWRHPALLAAAGAAIDQVSGGRFELGIGTGGSDLAYEQYGIRWPPLHERSAMADETARVVRALWAGGPVTFLGEHFALRDAYLSPTPLQPHVPIVVGGRGGSVLRLAARHADTWNTSVMPIEGYGVAREQLIALAQHYGRDGKAIRLSMTFRVAITSGSAETSRRRQDVVDEHGRYPEYLSEYLCIGTPAEVVAALLPYVRFGVRDLVVGFRPPVDHATMERFAKEVVPQVRAALRPPAL